MKQKINSGSRFHDGADTANLAALAAIGAVLANAGMDIATKLVAADLSAWQGVFMRWGYAAILLLGITILSKRPKPMPVNFQVHALRLALNLVGSASLFYALSHIDLWLTLTIFFLEPVCTVVLAAVILKQKLGAKKYLSLGVSLIGIFLITRPQMSGTSADALVIGIAFLGTFSWGALHLVTERLGHDQSTARLVLVIAVATASFSSVPAFVTWQPISIWHHTVMFCVAVLGTIHSYLWINAIKLSSAAAIALYGYLIVPLAFLAGIVFFDETIGLNAILGSALIVISVFFSSPPPGIWQRLKFSKVGPKG